MTDDYPICEGCGRRIDPDCCCCGTERQHHQFVEHMFVPANCDCYRDKGRDGLEAENKQPPGSR